MPSIWIGSHDCQAIVSARGDLQHTGRFDRSNPGRLRYHRCQRRIWMRRNEAKLQIVMTFLLGALEFLLPSQLDIETGQEDRASNP